MSNDLRPPPLDVFHCVVEIHLTIHRHLFADQRECAEQTAVSGAIFTVHNHGILVLIGHLLPIVDEVKKVEHHRLGNRNEIRFGPGVELELSNEARRFGGPVRKRKQK